MIVAQSEIEFLHVEQHAAVATVSVHVPLPANDTNTVYNASGWILIEIGLIAFWIYLQNIREIYHQAL